MPSEPEIRQFHVEVPEAELTDLRRRVNATRWPDRETVTGDSQGVRLAWMQDLMRYWGTGRGGHFAAWEQPDLFSAEMRASFKTLR